MAKSKGRPVIMPGLFSRARTGSKSRVTGTPINLAGSGIPTHKTSRPHKNSAKLDVSAGRGIIKMPLANNIERFPHPDIEWDGALVQKRFHSGRTDSSYGHYVLTNPTNNRGEALGTYHFHHTQGPHMPCCRSSGQRQAASIVNPYTGREIALGIPYIFEGQAYYSLNLVAQALTVVDTEGVTLAANNETGSFRVCQLGMSTSDDPGFRRVFRYPTNVFGRPRNNTLFETACGAIVLLCHTTQAPLDPIRCYAYISMEDLGDFMLGGNFFTEFTANMPANAWFFSHKSPLREITTPQRNDHFYVGDTLTVRATIQDVREATMLINGNSIETRAGLSGRELVFAGHELTESDVGSLTIGVNARNGHDSEVQIPSVIVNVSAVPEPSVRILTPQDGDAFYVGNSVAVEAEVQNATRTELAIGGHQQSRTHSLDSHNIRFVPYAFAAEDIGNVDINVTANNARGMLDSDTIRVQVKRNPRSEFLIALDSGHFVGTHARRTPQMPNVRQIDGSLELDWGSVNSFLYPGATAPHTVSTPDGEITIITPNGIVTPSGWNVSGYRANPAYGFPNPPDQPATERIQMREWEFNNAVAKYLEILLKNRGYSCFSVAPENDPRMAGLIAPDTPAINEPLNGVNNARRVRRANHTGDGNDINTFGRPADFYLSIHANAHESGIGFASANGVETFYQPAGRATSVESREYALIVQRRLMSVGETYGQRHRRVEPLDVAVLNSTTMPAVLTESGFFTNFNEAILLMDDTYRQKTAQCLLDAIDEIYELWKERR